MQRRTVAVLLAASVLGSASAGWLASSTIHSPAEVAARTAPPDPSAILVPVERRVLASEVVTRGTARFGAPRQLSLARSALKPDVGILSHVPVAGTELKEGDVAMLQSGRPVFVLAGSIPAYRDLGPGLEGADVRQLQEALARMGFDPGPVSGVYGPATEAAVAAWYRAAGFEPFVATADQLATIAARESDLLLARLDLLSAADAVAAATADEVIASVDLDAARRASQVAPGSVAAARASAEAANRVAAAEVASRQAAVALLRAGDAPGPAAIAAAEADLASALADAAEAERAGRAVVAEAAIALQQATNAAQQAATAVRHAQEDLAGVISTGAAEVDAARTALAELQAETDPRATASELAAARAALIRAENDTATAERAARAALSEVQVAAAAAPVAVAAARDQLAATQAAALASANAASSRVAAARATLAVARGDGPPPSPAAIAAAEADVEVARAAAAATRALGLVQVADAEAAAAGRAGELRVAESMATSARIVAADARATRAIRAALADLAAGELGTARRGAGVQVPTDEVLVATATPIRVQELLRAPGEPAEGPALVATNAIVAVDGSLPTAEAGLVEVGMVVQIDEPSLGIAATGVVSQVAESPGTNGVDGFHVYLEVLVDGNPATLPGTSVRLTIPVESSSGETLVVPVSAVTLASDGSSRVRVDRDGSLTVVRVDVGLGADGYVAVQPVGGALEEGDLVEVGQDASSGPEPVGAPTSSTVPGG